MYCIKTRAVLSYQERIKLPQTIAPVTVVSMISLKLSQPCNSQIIRKILMLIKYDIRFSFIDLYIFFKFVLESELILNSLPNQIIDIL